MYVCATEMTMTVTQEIATLAIHNLHNLMYSSVFVPNLITYYTKHPLHRCV